jgi:hypothetical protein
MNKNSSGIQKKQPKKKSAIEKKVSVETMPSEKIIATTKKDAAIEKKDSLKKPIDKKAAGQKLTEKKRVRKKAATKKILPKSVKIKSIQKPSLSNIVDGKPYYLKKEHEDIISNIVKKLDENICFIMLCSEDKNLSSYYKEVIVDLIKNKFELQILIFDSLSGPELLTIINQQIKNSTFKDLSGDSKNECHKYLIIDNEDSLTKLDWSLVEIIKKDFKFKKIGALAIRPDKFDANKDTSINRCFDFYEFDSLQDEDIAKHMQYVRNSEQGSYFLENMEKFNLLKYEISEEVKSLPPSLKQKIIGRFKPKN